MKFNVTQKIGIVGGSMFLFWLLYTTVIFPAVLDVVIHKKVSLKEGWLMRGIWGKFPFSMDFSFYMFNVTNPDEIKAGAKPKLQEVGPFVYDEWQEKTNQEDHEEDDTVSYTFRNTYYFNAEKSQHLTGHEEIIVPNYFVLGLVNIIMRERPSAVPIMGKAIDSILKKPDSIFIKAKVKDILFDGLTIDCTVKDFAGSAVCNELKQQYEDFGMKMVAENQYLLSLFGARNATDAKAKTRVYRGIKEIMKVGKVIEYNNKPNISVWNDDYCDAFNGTDGTVFHPFFDKKGREDIVAFNQGLCRSISLYYDNQHVKISGLKLLRYTTDLGTDGENNPLDRCYCEEPDKCLKKGAYDAFKCLGLPLIITNPHFHLADPYYLEQVEGISPVKEKHAIMVDIDPFVGLPLQAHTRAQFNMHIMKVEKFKLMKNFPSALLPLFWIDEQLILPPFLIKEITGGHLLYTLGKTFQYSLFFGSLVLGGLSGYRYYKETRAVNQVNKKKAQTKTVASNSSNSEKKVPISTLQPAPVPPTVD